MFSSFNNTLTEVYVIVLSHFRASARFHTQVVNDIILTFDSNRKEYSVFYKYTCRIILPIDQRSVFIYD